MTVLRDSRVSGGGSSSIPELTSDPASPGVNEAWVLRSGSGGTGGGVLQAITGLGFPYLSPNTGGSFTYEFSYRTIAGTTVRSTLS
jgi:hypothetical protein